eukprot:9235103-Pyramimonas_sp.AAC.1
MYVSFRNATIFASGPLGTPLRDLLGTSWGVLKACWAVLRPPQALGSDIPASPGSFGPSGKLLGPLLDRF